MNLAVRPGVAIGFSFLLVWTIAACARVPVPTSDQPKATAALTSSPALSPAATRELPSITATISIPTLEATTVPVATTGIPLPTIVPTPIATARSLTVQTSQSLVTYDRDPRALVLEADTFGGLAPVPRGAHVPSFRLYGDGLAVFAGERALLSTGLDAVVRYGYLSDSDMQSLLGYLTQTGFYSLDAFYQPRPAPADLATGRITVYVDKVKTVQVYGPGFPGTPQVFADAFARITKAAPADARTFVPVDGYLTSLAAGSVGDYRAMALQSWPADLGIRLADTGDGVTVSGSVYSSIVALIARAWPNTLYREGDRVYRVNFAPNLPRAVHLTDWISPILEAPREFDGRVFDIVGYFRGQNLFGEARGSGPTRKDWVVMDEGGAAFVTGAAPSGLDPTLRSDAWSLVRLRAAVVYVRSGTSYLEARRVEAIPSNVSSAAPLIANLDAAVSATKSRFPEMGRFKPARAGILAGNTSDIKPIERPDGWDLVFWEGWEDCPAGCVNNRYIYISVKKDGRMQKIGEFSRVYNSASNSFDTTGAPLWGVPK